HNWAFQADQIITTPRTLNSLAVMIDLFTDAGDGVIVQPPVFYDFKMIINANQRQLIKNPLRLDNGRYQMDFDNLQAVTAVPENKLLILCNPHNPVGRVWSKQDLSTLSEICIANGVFIIADEIHGDITFGNKYTPLASLSTGAALNCASCISPIKSFNLAGVSNSMIVIENDEKRGLCKDWYNRFEVNKNNVFTNAATIAAYTNGEPWLNQVTEYLAGNVEMLKSFLLQKIPRVKLIEPEGTYLLWLDFRDLGLEAKQLQSFLVQDARMALNPGHWFGREGAGFARLNIACPRSILKAALDRLENAVNKMSGNI
ncbi:MAG: PatB family C-S lyase, partial [Gammaproteobacteria bacterium]|nr:PatB family C-S lyase [Gammaproteobacteria bacterium]